MKAAMKRRFASNELHGTIDISDPDIHKTLSTYHYPANYVSSGANICDDKSEFALLRHQRFVAEYVKKNSSVLVFHGLGSGKTCTSLAAAELFKKYDNKTGEGDPDITAERVIICCPAKLKATFENEIMGDCVAQMEINGNSQKYVSTKEEAALKRQKSKIRLAERENNEAAYIEASKELRDIRAKIMEKVSLNYDIITHDTLYGKLFKVAPGGKREPAEYLAKGGPLVQPGTLLIIDEVQNLVSLDQSVKYKAFHDALTYYAHPSMRIMLMSATPVFNRPFEIGLTMNLLRPEIPFPTTETEFDKMFPVVRGDADTGSGSGSGSSSGGDVTLDPNTFRVKNADIFKHMTRGNVTYFTGGNPAAYPYVINTHIHSVMLKPQHDAYVQTMSAEIATTFSSVDKVFGSIADLLGEDDKKKIKKAAKKENPGLFGRSQQCLLCDDIGLLKETGNKQSYARLRKLDYKAKMAKIKGWSIKFYNIIKLMESSDRPVFVYMNYVQRGLTLFAKCLDLIGKSAYTKGGDPADLYALWHGGTPEPETRVIREAFNGGKIKLVVSTITEGISFLNVGQVHIVSPWWNDKRLKQVAARAVRFRSHCGIPEGERYVHIFNHLIVLPEEDAAIRQVIEKQLAKIMDIPQYNKKTGNKEEQNAKIREAMAKARADRQSAMTQGDRVRKGPGMQQMSVRTIDQVMERSAVFKSVKNNHFEKMLKETAVDAKLNANANVVQLRETYMPFVTREKLPSKRLDKKTGKPKDAYILREDRNTYVRLFRNPNTGQCYMTERQLLVSLEDILGLRQSSFRASSVQLWETTEQEGVFTRAKKAPFAGLIFREDRDFSKRTKAKPLSAHIKKAPELHDLVNKGKVLRAVGGHSTKTIRQLIRRCLEKTGQIDLLKQISKKNWQTQMFDTLVKLGHGGKTEKKQALNFRIWTNFESDDRRIHHFKTTLLPHMNYSGDHEKATWKQLANAYIKQHKLDVKYVK